MAQTNYKLTETFKSPPEGYYGFGFDSNGNPVRINPDGSTTIIPLNDEGGNPVNIIANRGVGPQSEVPTDPVTGDYYVTNDTNEVYYRTSSTNWQITDLISTQFVTSDEDILYQFDGTTLNSITTPTATQDGDVISSFPGTYDVVLKNHSDSPYNFAKFTIGFRSDTDVFQTLDVIVTVTGQVMKVEPSHYVEGFDDLEVTAVVASNVVTITLTFNSSTFSSITITKPLITYIT